jgi:hypothetical protein
MYRIIRENGDNKNSKKPVMPILMVLSNNSIIESDSITGLVAALMGDDYVNANENNKCLMRIKLARRESMAALRFGISSVVVNDKEIIKNNYGVKDDDKDYKFTDEEMKNVVRIRIDNEKDFIVSLVSLGSIGVLERENSDLFLKEKKDLKDNECDYVDIEYDE